MGTLFSYLSEMTTPTPPPTEAERERLATIRPATIEEIDAALDRAGFRRFLGAGG